jgi:hypothetical protein
MVMNVDEDKSYKGRVDSGDTQAVNDDVYYHSKLPPIRKDNGPVKKSALKNVPKSAGGKS